MVRRRRFLVLLALAIVAPRTCALWGWASNKLAETTEIGEAEVAAVLPKAEVDFEPEAMPPPPSDAAEAAAAPDGAEDPSKAAARVDDSEVMDPAAEVEAAGSLGRDATDLAARAGLEDAAAATEAEFRTASAAPESPKADDAEMQAKEARRRPPLRKPQLSDMTTVDYAGLAIIALYIVVFALGSRRNTALAAAWADAIHPVLAARFAHVGPAYSPVPPAPAGGAASSSASGDAGSSNGTSAAIEAAATAAAARAPPPGTSVLARESQDTFLCYATGRRGCLGLVAQLQLARRQDLLSVAYYAAIRLSGGGGGGASVARETGDTLTVSVAVPADAMPPVVLAICRRFDAAAFRAAEPDVKDLCGKPLPAAADAAAAAASGGAALPPALAVLAETADLASLLLPPTVLRTLSELEENVELVHVTDRNTAPVMGFEPPTAAVLRFKFRFTRAVMTGAAVAAGTAAGEGGGGMARMARLMEAVVLLADHLSRFRMDPEKRKKAEKRRREVDEKQQKEQGEDAATRVQRLREEKLKRERESYESLTAEQKRKRDEKEDKKKAKAASRGRMKQITATAAVMMADSDSGDGGGGGEGAGGGDSGKRR